MVGLHTLEGFRACIAAASVSSKSQAATTRRPRARRELLHGFTSRSDFVHANTAARASVRSPAVRLSTAAHSAQARGIVMNDKKLRRVRPHSSLGNLTPAALRPPRRSRHATGRDAALRPGHRAPSRCLTWDSAQRGDKRRAQVQRQCVSKRVCRQCTMQRFEPFHYCYLVRNLFCFGPCDR
jgi:hypothetical protein